MTASCCSAVVVRREFSAKTRNTQSSAKTLDITELRPERQASHDQSSDIYKSPYERVKRCRERKIRSSDTYKTIYERVKRCRERKINIKASERVNVDVFTQNKRPCPKTAPPNFFLVDEARVCVAGLQAGSVSLDCEKTSPASWRVLVESARTIPPGAILENRDKNSWTGNRTQVVSSTSVMVYHLATTSVSKKTLKSLRCYSLIALCNKQLSPIDKKGPLELTYIAKPHVAKMRKNKLSDVLGAGRLRRVLMSTNDRILKKSGTTSWFRHENERVGSSESRAVLAGNVVQRPNLQRVAADPHPLLAHAPYQLEFLFASQSHARANQTTFISVIYSRIFINGNRCRMMLLVGGFSRESPLSLRLSIPALLHSHLISPSSALKTTLLRASQISQTQHPSSLRRTRLDHVKDYSMHHLTVRDEYFTSSPLNCLMAGCTIVIGGDIVANGHKRVKRFGRPLTSRSREPMNVKRGEHGAAPKYKEQRKREIPEKTRRPAASFVTIPTCEDPPGSDAASSPGEIHSPGKSHGNILKTQ
ncbi:hypothetical protein PR048_016108 [Dryococelus australis]|uniref:Uncharacterized protein n=1 Tax=Dryococelus australis TaxID=614101 RepID=A0ABQ9HIT6_9NEOP|nr:hypothetical protein PR048_016108 [Dryococelus australis]